MRKAVVSLLVLALVALAAPALAMLQTRVRPTSTATCDGAGPSQHPSGKDRSCESGGSGNQGNAQSDPDDDTRGPDRTNGGDDKPGGPGGVDKNDQDSNNGCGNDQDFEDDNEGLCKGPREPYSGGRPRGQPQRLS